MFRKILCTLISLILVSSVAISAASITTVNSEEPHLVSVENYPQVTDLDDLLALAMRQYEERAVMRNNVHSLSNSESDEIVATQVLQEASYSDGSIIRRVSNTALLLVDENGEKISASDYRANYHQTSGTWGAIYGSLEFCVDEMIGGAPTIRGIYVKAATGYGGPYQTTMIRTGYHVVEEWVYERSTQTQDFPNPRPAQVCQMNIQYKEWVQLNSAISTYAQGYAFFYNNQGTVDEYNGQYVLVIDAEEYYKT